MKDPSGYGRIVRDESGGILKIVEELHLTPEERVINEIKTGTYCFNIQALKSFLPLLPKNEEKGEYYLTDLVTLVSRFGVKPPPCGRCASGAGDQRSPPALPGCCLMREKINERLMLEGVTIIDPFHLY